MERDTSTLPREMRRIPKRTCDTYTPETAFENLKDAIEFAGRTEPMFRDSGISQIGGAVSEAIGYETAGSGRSDH
jgi:hypothetical protein